MHIFEALTPTQVEWLTSKESLTLRLRTFTKNKISLHLFYDDWGITDENTEAWIRRMEWRYFDEVWVAATVIIPEQSITEDTMELTRIGDRSIGDVLFQDPTLTRTDFVFNPLKNNVWSRHSIFHFKKKPISIIENFYPAFLDAVCKT
jgi:chorismate lyase